MSPSGRLRVHSVFILLCIVRSYGTQLCTHQKSRRHRLIELGVNGMSDKRIYDVNLKRPDDTDKEDPKNKQLAIKSSG